jgi:hypothetical protein
MMDYIRWLVFEKFRNFFESGVFVPVIFLNMLFVGILTAAYWPLGLVLIILSVVYWGVILFIFIQRAYIRSMVEFEKYRNRNK